MTSVLILNETNLLIRLQKQWLKWSMIVFSIWVLTAAALAMIFNLTNGIFWGGISLVIIIWQNIGFYQKLTKNRKNDSSPLIAYIGIANWITLTRGVLIAFLSGFILMVKPDNWILWVPAILYLVASILDYLDGIVARITNSGTLLGADLDIDMDGLGVIVASLVAIHYGQIPLVYLLVGIARYLFLIGISIRRKRGLVVKSLPASPYRRGLAGAQMGFLVAVLFPVFKPPATSIAAIFFMTPFLISFLMDWLSVSNFKNLSKIHAKWLQNLPLLWRFSMIIWAIMFIYNGLNFPVNATIILFLLALLSISGIASRSAAFGSMIWSGFVLRQQPENVWFWILLIISSLIFLSGSGRYSIWKPEDLILYHRFGEHKNGV